MKSNISKDCISVFVNLKLCIEVFFLLLSASLYSQEKSVDSSIVSNFQYYNSQYRELAYSHLNKSTYIKGEFLGYKAYVFDKASKKPSILTKNLYCVVLDSLDNIIKQKMTLVENGTSHNVFEIDSLFTTGVYTFKAYTNWMKNFDEPNIFTEKFNVIDPDKTSIVKSKRIKNVLDAQFLPEGGHFVDNVKTNVGVVVKNIEGYGVSGIKGSVYDSDGLFITSFQLNDLGIGRFLLFPKISKTYVVEIKYLNTLFEYKIDNIQKKGIVIHVNKSKDKLALELKTNKETLNLIKNKPYKITVHNGALIEQIKIKFNKTDIVQFVDFKTLFPGINIITLFNEKNQPILERLYFKNNAISYVNLEKPSVINQGDSLRISIPVKSKLSEKDNASFSISVLPEETKSYNRHHNLVSYIYLQPYLHGFIENASYYFTDISSQKKYELDNLLITQGWSSYNWNSIFNYDNNQSYDFEDGISIKGNVVDSETKNFIIYPMSKSESSFVDISSNEKSFYKSGLYPQTGDTLNLSVFNNKGKVRKPKLYMQFSPLKIPEFNSSFFAYKAPKQESSLVLDAFNLFDFKGLEQRQDLEEVVVKASVKQIRIDKLKRSSLRKVDVFDDAKRMQSQSFVSYINNYMFGFTAREINGDLIIKNSGFEGLSRSNRFVNKVPSVSSGVLIFLDDFLIRDYNFLLNLDMRTIDYIAYDKYGFGAEGFRGGKGLIKIYTSPDFLTKAYNSIKDYKKFKFPLVFSEPKKYYVPKYKTFNNDFYKYYGVIDWIPTIGINKKGTLDFKISNPSNSNLKLFIEGTTSSGAIISTSKTLNIKPFN